jgi:hypothetical protein
MNRAWSEGPSYWDVLVLLICKDDPRWQYDYWCGTIFIPLTDGGDLWATPMWEGDPLPWQVLDADGNEVAVGEDLHVRWTGRLRDDLQLFKLHAGDLVRRFGPAAGADVLDYRSPCCGALLGTANDSLVCRACGGPA